MSTNRIPWRRLVVPYAGSAAQRAYDMWFTHCGVCATCMAGPRVAEFCAERSALWGAYLHARAGLTG